MLNKLIFSFYSLTTLLWFSFRFFVYNFLGTADFSVLEGFIGNNNNKTCMVYILEWGY